MCIWENQKISTKTKTLDSVLYQSMKYETLSWLPSPANQYLVLEVFLCSYLYFLEYSIFHTSGDSDTDCSSLSKSRTEEGAGSVETSYAVSRVCSWAGHPYFRICTNWIPGTDPWGVWGSTCRGKYIHFNQRSPATSWTALDYSVSHSDCPC